MGCGRGSWTGSPGHRALGPAGAPRCWSRGCGLPLLEVCLASAWGPGWGRYQGPQRGLGAAEPVTEASPLAMNRPGPRARSFVSQQEGTLAIILTNVPQSAGGETEALTEVAH